MGKVYTYRVTYHKRPPPATLQLEGGPTSFFISTERCGEHIPAPHRRQLEFCATGVSLVPEEEHIPTETSFSTAAI